MKARWETVREALVLAGSAVFCMVVVGFFLYEPMRTEAFWRGERGWLDVLAGLGTFAAATTAAWLAWRNYLLGQKKDSTERFEKGVALFESPGYAQRAAGIIVLEDLATTEAEGRRAEWIREFLIHAINQWNLAQMSLVGRPVTAADFDKTDEITLRALAAFSKIRDESPPVAFLRSFYLSKAFVAGHRLASIRALDCLLYDADFVGTDLRNSIIRGAAFGALAWEDCDLSKGRIRFSRDSSADVHIKDCDLSGAYIYSFGSTEITFENCKLDGAKISGSSDATIDKCWFDETPPEIRNVSALTGYMGLYKGSGRVDRTTARGLKVWEPMADDVPVQKSLVAPGPILRRVPKA
ncbi:hypothetical protein [Devosia sp. XK-2]|uniref:pentapeptide repeat-containing protein n=1 Tax=Devosia sp. XK-2 TaxID=3126689 RepID=UPI0030CEFBE3